MKSLLWAAAIFTALFTLPVQAEEDCRLHIVASIPMENLAHSNGIAIPVTIGGKQFRFLVDTGATHSFISDTAADALGLKRHSFFSVNVDYRFFGGERSTSYVETRDMTIGGTPVPATRLLVIREGRIKGGSENIDGLIGGNFLTLFDVDFDFANSKMNLFLPHPCAGRAVYWTADESKISKFPFSMSKDHHSGGHIIARAEVDGKAMDALVDTGASISHMDMELAKSTFGITEQSPGMQPLGKDVTPKTDYRYTFKQMQIGGISIDNPLMILSPREHTQVTFDTILGMNVLRQLHLFIAYKERMLYVTAANERHTAAGSQ